ncbi:MAG: carbamoyltransferase HypF [Chloroflexota bacterium]|nr:MAG: carbamoyltransferase HypF [Chloroflexota bacterium]
MSKAAKQPLRLASISVRGIVQGVGFRPFVYGLAVKHNLKGWVYNTSEDVKIEVEGKADAVGQFEREIQTQAPPLAHVETVNVEYNPPRHYKKFEIRNSRAQEGKYQLISPDIATCQACLDEVKDTEDRRYRYPFTNCTNCGPRFTIIEDMPYDRPKTTMHSFQMCSQCQAEYDNPLDRRFHAQPNACPTCGPHVELVDNQGNLITESNPITAASQFLKKGKILAIKGLGGFLLACDATNDTVVKELRQRKKRSSKPFAIMVTDVEQAQEHCYISPEEEDLLTSPQSPIVLVKWREESSVSPEVAPNLRFLGVMLPYTPLHHILLRDTGLPLVMTSGNLSEEPIARDNDEALKRLSGIADYFLMHNRDIYSRYDDSVAMIERGASQLVRRARSYAPYPIRLPFETKQVLGCGAEEKNTFCLTKDSYAFLSQHIGDMENIETLEHFNDTISLYRRLFRVEPEIIAHDLHPDYLATKYARELSVSGMKLVPVQHHHAHIASCMADNGLKSKVIGVAFDGTGMGADGNIWGGEFLVADYRNYERAGHLEYLPLPGGAAAIKRPYRTAIGYILTLLGENALNCDLPVMKEADDIEMEVIKRQIERRINSPPTSSMGRLFDAVSALLGIRSEIDYEGQAAVELEMAAHREGTRTRESYPYRILEDEGVNIVYLRDLLSAVIEDLEQDVSKGSISVKFHNTIARMIDEMCRLTADKTGITQVALSGGVFQNRLLLRKAINLLESSGFQVFTHRQAPCNDGGISLGQAVIANFAL